LVRHFTGIAISSHIFRGTSSSGHANSVPRSILMMHY